MKKMLTIHGTIAALGTLAAALAWHSPRENTALPQVMVHDGTPQDLKSIIWVEEDNRVRVVRDGTAVSVTAGKTSEEHAGRSYPGSPQAQELFSLLAPFYASRSLGHPEADRLTAFGLDATKTQLILQDASGQHVFDIGNNTFGSGDTYVQAPSREVFLVRSNVLGTLRHGALSLQDRDVLNIKREQIYRVLVESAGQKFEAIQRYPEDAAKAFFADPVEPDKRLDLLGNWLDRILKLRLIEIGGEMPVGPPGVSITFADNKETVAYVKIWHPGEKSAVVMSSRFKEPVQVGRANAEVILKDMENVLKD